MSEASKPQKCRYCGSPVRKGTGLFLCGEGIAGHVEGGCRHDDTAAVIRNLYEQLEAVEKERELWQHDCLRAEVLQREYAASREISKWALETKRCDDLSPGGAMLCDREPGHEGIHVNWQGTEWKNTSEDASYPASRSSDG